MKILFKNIRSGKRRAAITDLNSIARKEIERAMDTQVKPLLIKSHEIIVANWKNKPGFDSKKYIKPSEIAISVFPTGENAKIWGYVDQGTKPHDIEPKRAKMLHFAWGGPGSYVSKTLARPARTVSSGGYVQNPVETFRKKVHHPGTEPRNFSKEIASDIQPDFKKLIENAFRRTAAEVEE